MIDTGLAHRNKVRGVAIFFAIFLSLVLYQNPEGMAGRFTALLSILLVFVSSLLEKVLSKKQVVFNVERVLLFVFLLCSVFTTTLSGVSFSYIEVFVVQLLLCALLFNTNITNKEFAIIKYVYILSMVFCSIMSIRSCLTTTRSFHGDIELFGAMLDPNYIGIPIVFASVITLGEVLLEKKYRIIGIIAFLIFIVAVLFTASRGNSLAFLLGNGLVVLHYLKTKNTKMITKVLFLALMIALLLFLLNSSYFEFSDSFERMTTFGEGADNGRFEIWKRSMLEWEKHPIFGIGLVGSYFEYKQASHNTYVQILLETGLVGFILMIVFIVRLLVTANKYDKSIFFAFCALLLQIAFLDCLINRCFWPYACWIALLPRAKTSISYL